MRPLGSFARWIKQHMLALNLFDSPEARTNPLQLRIAILSTRIYLVLFTLVIAVLILYSSLSPLTQTVNIKSPSETTYTQLYANYDDSLSCPCKNLAISYKDLFKISINYHPICTSWFITDTWINGLFIENITDFEQKDFRLVASSYFQLLNVLCSVAKRSVENAIDDIFSKILFTQYLISPISLNTQIEEEISSTLNSAANILRQHDEFVRKAFHSNQLQTEFSMPRIFSYSPIFPNSGTNSGLKAAARTILTDNGTSCNCVYTPTCSAQTIYEEFNATEKPIGFRMACYAIEGLLQSTLECLFIEDCLQSIFVLFPRINITNIDVLHSNSTIFTPETTVETLFGELFIEDRFILSLYSNFYDKCAPISCTYTFTQIGNPVFVLTTLFGLLGGIIIVLRLCVFYIVSWACSRSVTSLQIDERISLSIRLKMFGQQLITLIINLNLFETADAARDPFELTTTRIITRVYLITLATAIIIIIFYTSITFRLKNEIVDNPSQTTFEILQETYSSTLKCSCSDITIPYGSFISISPILHPVCSSWLISDSWIEHLTTIQDRAQIDTDFRKTAPSFFRTLSTLCSLANEVLPLDYLLVRVSSTIQLFQTSTVDEFKRTLAIINFQTQTTLIADGGNVDIVGVPRTEYGPDVYGIDVESRIKGNCSCDIDDNCVDQLNLYRYHYYYGPLLIISVPNFFAGCSLIDSVRLSTLECFYNESCLNPLIDVITEDVSFATNTPILKPMASRFLPNTWMSSVVDELMIDQWNVVIKYNHYYDQCKPSHCSYTFQTRGDRLYIFSNVIGIFGGLVVILKICIPVLVRLVRMRMKSQTNNRQNEGELCSSERIRRLLVQFKNRLLQFNLFESRISWIDSEQHQAEIITTRFYLISLTICIIIVSIYTSSIIQTKLYTIDNPSKETFDQLNTNQDYLSTLDCPCQNLTIGYDRFVHLTPSFHQICSSDFVKTESQWLKLFSDNLLNNNYAYDDFRLFIVPQFRSLASLCTIAQQTVYDALVTFMSNTLISKRAESLQTIESQINSTIIHFHTSTRQAFLLIFNLIKGISKGNRLISTTLSNWYLNDYIEDMSVYTTIITVSARTYKNDTCTCGSSETCVSSASIDEWFVPGFLVGCFPIESLLQSTLQCLYNLTCINTIISNITNPQTIFRSLNSSQSNPFVTVESLVEFLFIDRWNTQITYDQYYTSCSPLRCTYLLNTRFDGIFIFTSIMGISGGLTVILKLIIPFITKLYQYFIQHRRRHIQPIANMNIENN
ncbi:hypothetical protein I4U23_027107 [Adineta vaga]|nr:hypothetical protein I4U23_027107 [Adineta vaga]